VVIHVLILLEVGEDALMVNVSGCYEGETKCDGICVDTQSDPNNCGGCDIKCTAPPGEVSRCINGGCTIPECREGTTKCDGICVDTQSDDYNCGGCGFACHCYEGDPRCCLYYHNCFGHVPHCRDGVCSV
jgi:hypothetical protein